VETSNLVLLVAGGGGGGGGGMDAGAGAAPAVTVAAVSGSNLELAPAAPRLGALRRLLAAAPYGALTPDGSDGTSVRGAAFAELLAAVPASAAELRAGLEDAGAVRLDGRWHGVDAGYLGTLLELVLLTAVERGWRGALPVAAAAEAAAEHGYRPELAAHCLRRFGAPAAGAALESVDLHGDGEQPAAAAYDLAPAAVCRHFGLKLLAERPRWEERAEFAAAWAAAVPEGMAPELAMLRGEALADAEPGRGLEALPAAGLPEAAAPRFAALFAKRPRWELADLAPYVEDLAGPGQTAEELLLRYARATQARPADPVTYSAR
jgi:sister chromatid cohesion protein DCC1